jgi:hypothetical protein
MASFLARAMKLKPIVPPPPPPPGDNKAPVVSAGSDATVTRPASAALDGTVTDDGLPTTGSLTSAWSKVSGPGTATFGDEDAVDTSAKFSAAGVYVLRLTADDGALSNSDDVKITVNAATTPDTTNPVIDMIGNSPRTVKVGGTYNDQGATASDDFDGDITSSIVTVSTVNTSTPGMYTVTYDVSDAAGNPADQKVRTVFVITVGNATQVSDFLTGYTGPNLTTDQLPVPSVDPAGITYHDPSGHLFIVDSEINEPNLAAVYADAGGNVFEVSLDGTTLFGTYDFGLTGTDQEPTGIAYDASDAVAHVFYVTNDVTRKLYRYIFTSGSGFALDDSVSTAAAGFTDPEGLTVDGAGNIYVIDEKSETVLIYTYGSGGFTLVTTLDLGALNPTVPVPRSPEGIAFDSVSGHLFIVSQWDLPYAVFEYEIDGDYVKRYDIGGFVPDYEGTPLTPNHNLTKVDSPQGITFGPSSGTGLAFYLTDGGVDNGTGVAPPDAIERDGVIYEGQL